MNEYKVIPQNNYMVVDKVIHGSFKIVLQDYVSYVISSELSVNELKDKLFSILPHTQFYIRQLN